MQFCFLFLLQGVSGPPGLPGELGRGGAVVRISVDICDYFFSNMFDPGQ